MYLYATDDDDYFRPPPYTSDNDEDDDNNDEDSDDQYGIGQSPFECPSEQKKPRLTATGACFAADTCEGRFYAPIYSAKKTNLYYAEISTRTKTVARFSEEKLNEPNARHRTYGVAIAYEAGDDPPNNSPQLNRVVLLSKHAKNNNLRVNGSCAYICQQSFINQGPREKLIVSRRHAEMPALRTESRTHFIMVENNQTWITSSKDERHTFRGIEFRSLTPGKEERAHPRQPLPHFIPFAFKHNARLSL
jgi:hypothetical protein